ncbi:hypothetical protein HDV00_005484 [Rhizophlyctis rosea]|nr:hypothetical protein HDV00_005484 [Rhizophlyctis rosea]
MPGCETLDLTVQNVTYCNSTSPLTYEFDIWAEISPREDPKQYNGTCRSPKLSAVSCANNTTDFFYFDSAPISLQLVIKDDNSTWYGIYNGTAKCDKGLVEVVSFSEVNRRSYRTVNDTTDGPLGLPVGNEWGRMMRIIVGGSHDPTCPGGGSNPVSGAEGLLSTQAVWFIMWTVLLVAFLNHRM